MTNAATKKTAGDITIGLKPLILDARITGINKATVNKIIMRFCEYGRMRKVMKARPISIKDATQKLGALITAYFPIITIITINKKTLIILAITPDLSFLLTCAPLKRRAIKYTPMNSSYYIAISIGLQKTCVP